MQARLSLGDEVRFVGLEDSILVERTGVIVGLAIDHIIQHCIIELDQAVYNESFAAFTKYIAMPSVCLERIKN
jgi:hypothetical protein